MGEFSVED